MATNPDFSDLLSALCAEGAEFVVGGAHAVMFGAPVADLSVDDLAVKGTIFQIGVAPNRIDVLTSIDAVEFDAAYPRSVQTTYGTVPMRVLSVDDLVTNKRAVGRKQDEIDLENLAKAGKR